MITFPSILCICSKNKEGYISQLPLCVFIWRLADRMRVKQIQITSKLGLEKSYTVLHSSFLLSVVTLEDTIEMVYWLGAARVPESSVREMLGKASQLTPIVLDRDTTLCWVKTEISEAVYFHSLAYPILSWLLQQLALRTDFIPGTISSTLYI